MNTIGQCRGVRLTLSGLSVFVLILFGARPTVAAVYDVIDLGTLGGTSSQASGINNSGQIVGYANTLSNAASHAVLWTNSGSPAIDLGVLSGDGYSVANDISDSGQIVGQSSNSTNFQPVVWTNSLSPPIDLGTLGGSFGGASGINTSGQVVGSAYTVNNANSLAAFWSNSSSSATSLASLNGGTMSAASGINNSGGIVGWSNDSGELQHATFWTNSSSPAVDLWLGEAATSSALGINDSGQIVGWGLTLSGQRGIVWNSSSSSPIELGTFGGNNGIANGINGLGQIVGWADDGSGNQRAALWTNSATPAIDLNSLIPASSGWFLLSATGINNSREIVGYGIINGQTHGFALVPLAAQNLVITVVGASVQLAYSTELTEFYDVQRIGSLPSGSWTTIASNVMGTGSTVTNVDLNAANVPQRFYRVGAHF
jgi:probable HAF family extracellular repeat protein